MGTVNIRDLHPWQVSPVEARRIQEEQVGAAVRTRPSHSPLFVSPGHKIGVETAVRVVLACCRQERFIPEPTRLAHALVTRQARELRR